MNANRFRQDVPFVGLAAVLVCCMTASNYIYCQDKMDAESAAIKALKKLHEDNGSFRSRGNPPEYHVVALKRSDESARYAARIENLVYFASMGETDLTDAGLLALEGKQLLTGLDVIGEEITTAGFRILPSLKNLATLDIHARQVNGDEVCQYLRSLKRLRKLRLGVKLTDKGLALLTDLPEVVELGLGDTDVCKAISVVRTMPKLENLELYDTCIDDEAIQALKDHPSVRNLNISKDPQKENYIPLTDEGAIVLGTIKNLEFVAFGGSKITRKSILALKPLEKLRTINIKEVDFDLDLLEAIHEVPQLTRVFIGGGAKYMKCKRSEFNRISKKKPNLFLLLD